MSDEYTVAGNFQRGNLTAVDYEYKMARVRAREEEMDAIRSAASVGWTVAEYAQCPELIDRLHRRILELEGIREAAMDVVASYDVRNPLASPRAWTEMTRLRSLCVGSVKPSVTS